MALKMGRPKELPEYKIQKRLDRVRKQLSGLLRRIEARTGGDEDRTAMPCLTEDEYRAIECVRKAYEAMAREWSIYVNQGPLSVVLNFDTMSTEELRAQLQRSKGQDFDQ